MSNEKLEIQQCISTLATLPPGEMQYYLLLLLKSMHDNSSKVDLEFINKVKIFINNFKGYLQDKITAEVLVESYQVLIKQAKINRFSLKCGYAILQIGSIILAFIFAVIGAIIGAITGFIRGIIKFSNPLSALGIGLATGILVSSSIGFRLLKKLFKDPFTRQLKNCLDHLEDSIKNADHYKEFANKKAKIEQEILQNYFNCNEKEFEEFLNTNKKYEICALEAEFFSPTLRGFLGHHAFIKLPFEKDGKKQTLEFAFSPSDTTENASQTEQREVLGAKIIEMMALHELLQQTHGCNLRYIATKMKSAEQDCFSYVNMILIGTGQDAMQTIKRFDGTENIVGRAIGFFAQKLSPFREDIFVDNIAAP